MTTPAIAIVGRPNVGKSTLFNRLVGRRRAIVHDQPGVTRDRISGRFSPAAGREAHLIDTGGLVPGDDPIGLNRQVMAAIEESDLLLLVVDGKVGLTAADEEVWEALRRRGKPTVLVVNKADTRSAQENVHEFARLGMATTVLVSAEHGTGVGDLLAAIAERIEPAPAPLDDPAPRLAIVGRPNVGKSSLLNRIAGDERMLVSERPGTTRDPVDTTVERDGERWVLVDTAGIRRRSRVEDAPEELAVMMARRQIESADVALLVIDAAAGVTSGDLAIAGAVWEMGKPAVVLVNKWDLLDDEGRRELEESWPRLASLMASPRRVNTSAVTGRGVDKIFPAVRELLEVLDRTFATSEVNELFQRLAARHHPPTRQGRPWKLYYATQVASSPPTFMLFANRVLTRADSYRRYLENGLREALGYAGIPVRLVVRKRT